MWDLVTLDGFFEGPKSWDLDFHQYAWGEELEKLTSEQLKTVGVLLFGRATYEGMANYWSKEKGEKADFMNSLPKIVFSKTLDKAEWKNSSIVRENASKEVAKLKLQPGKDLFIFGSADLSSSLMKESLVDEVRVCIVPVILGHGNPLFKPSELKMEMKLLEAKPLKTGGVILRYQIEKKDG